MRGTGLARVTTVEAANGEFEHSWPEFLPDGRRFVFIVRNRREERGGVFIGSLDAPGKTRLMPQFSRVACAAPGYLVFARAGSLVARQFNADRSVLSGDELPLASGVKSHTEGDGAFDVSATGVLVYRRNEACASPPTGDRWQVSTAGGGDPQWRGAGQELYYIAPDGWLMATEVVSVAPFRTRRPQRLFTVAVPEMHGASDYAVSPDGQRFVVNTVMGPPLVPPIQVVVNWSALAAR